MTRVDGDIVLKENYLSADPFSLIEFEAIWGLMVSIVHEKKMDAKEYSMNGSVNDGGDWLCRMRYQCAGCRPTLVYQAVGKQSSRPE